MCKAVRHLHAQYILRCSGLTVTLQWLGHIILHEKIAGKSSHAIKLRFITHFTYASMWKETTACKCAAPVTRWLVLWLVNAGLESRIRDNDLRA